MYRAAALGLIAGVLAGLSRVHLAGPVDELANSISTWLIAPFVLGALAPTPRRAAVHGALASLGQLAGFYAVTAAYGIGTTAGSVAVWVAAAIGGGATFGAAGQRRWLAVLAAAFFIEGVLDTGAPWIAAGAALAALSGLRRAAPRASRAAARSRG